jgi:hypothetical protein
MSGQRGAFSAEFLPLRNRDLGPLAVTVLPIPLARRAAATAAPPCNQQRPFFVAGEAGDKLRPQRLELLAQLK